MRVEDLEVGIRIAVIGGWRDIFGGKPAMCYIFTQLNSYFMCKQYELGRQNMLSSISAY